MNIDKELVECMKQTRHDWLNKLQLIRGYHALGQSERLTATIESIVYEMDQQSKLSSMGMDRIAVFIFRYGWTSQPLILTYEIIGPTPALQMFEDVLYSFFTNLVEQLEKFVDQSETSHSLHISFESDKETVVYMDFNGKFKNIASWQHILESICQECALSITIEALNQSAFTLSVSLDRTQTPKS
ncbi:MAG: Spo0B domain-containing protein [Bacilli bacterium]